MGAAKVLIIDENDNYLMMVRSNHPRFGNDSDLPGGTIEAGESPEIAAVREVDEEAGIKITLDDIELLYSGLDYSEHNIKYFLYQARVTARPAVTLSWEHSGYNWLTRDEFLHAAKNSVDTYMHMVYDVVSKRLN